MPKIKKNIVTALADTAATAWTEIPLRDERDHFRYFRYPPLQPTPPIPNPIAVNARPIRNETLEVGLLERARRLLNEGAEKFDKNKFTTSYWDAANPVYDDATATPKNMTTIERIKSNRTFRNSLLQRHINIMGRNNMMCASRFEYDGVKSRPDKIDLGVPARKLIKKNEKTFATAIKFLKAIGADKFCYREYILNNIENDYGDILGRTLTSRKNTSKYTAFCDVKSKIIDMVDVVENNLCFYSDEWIQELQVFYINGIIRTLHQAGTHNHIEEIEMKSRCYVLGADLTNQNKNRVKIFKRWGKGVSYRTTTVSDGALVKMIPIYKVDNMDDFNLETGDTKLESSGYTSLDYLMSAYRELHVAPIDYGLTLFMISQGEDEKWVVLEMGDNKINDPFIQQNVYKHTLAYYRTGLIATLPYATQPIYHIRPPTRSSSTHFGLEVEVDTKYDRKHAILDEHGSPMLPMTVLQKLNWAITFDRSIGGFELKSPIITDAIPWSEQIPDGVKRLIDTTAKDNRCGGHIHMSTSNNPDAFFRFQFWTWLFSIIYPKRLANEYCQIVLQNSGTEYQYKRQWLRLRSKTVEIRIFPAVLNCRNIYWRLDLLRKIHLCNIHHKPKSVEDTISIWMSNTDHGMALRKHVLAAKEIKSMRMTLQSKAGYFDLTSNGILPDGTIHKFVILNNGNRYILDNDLAERTKKSPMEEESKDCE